MFFSSLFLYMFSPSSDVNPFQSLFVDRDHFRSNMGIISGPGSFAVQFGDHLRSWDYLRTRTAAYDENTEVKIPTDTNVLSCGPKVSKHFGNFGRHFPVLHPQKSSQCVRACTAHDGAICSKKRKIFPYHGDSPKLEIARLRSPSPIMVPVMGQLSRAGWC